MSQSSLFVFVPFVVKNKITKKQMTKVFFLKRILAIIVVFLLLSYSVKSQSTTQPDSLLNKLTRKWVLQGTIDGKESIHDINAKRVLNGQYIQLEEVSREKDEKGNPLYEAIVYICWQEAKKEYFCLWLDNTSNEGISNGIIGRAKQNDDKIEMLFKYSDAIQFHTTFLYDRDADTWQWIMDSDENGKLQPFARVKLTRN
jgi:hypothetical protein